LLAQVGLLEVLYEPVQVLLHLVLDLKLETSVVVKILDNLVHFRTQQTLVVLCYHPRRHKSQALDTAAENFEAGLLLPAEKAFLALPPSEGPAEVDVAASDPDLGPKSCPEFFECWGLEVEDGLF